MSSVLNSKSDLNRLFPFAKKKPNIPGKLSDKVDPKTIKPKLIEDKNSSIPRTSESIRCDVLTENNEKAKPVGEVTYSNEIYKNSELETCKATTPSEVKDLVIKPKSKKSRSRKSSNISEVSIDGTKKPKENYQRWNIPLSNKFKGQDFDKTLLTMQDLIYYNPVTNPIVKQEKIEPKEEDDPDNDLLPFGTIKDEKPNILSKNCITPCIKVGADGKIIIDQETLTLNETGLEEKREELAKAKVIEESAFDPRKYSYRRKVEPSKQWTKNETFKFYKCLMNLGTDFSMIGQYFPGRTRAQIKRKYKSEERKNPDLINGALSTTTHYNSDLIENMFQDAEESEVDKNDTSNKQSKSQQGNKNIKQSKLKEAEDTKVDTNDTTTKKSISQKRYPNVKRSDCSNTMSVCALMMEEEIVLKKRQPNKKSVATASKLKEEILLLKNLKGKNKKIIKSIHEIDEETETISPTKVESTEPKPKVRRLQDFHEEYEETITKYEDDSNSE